MSPAHSRATWPALIEADGAKRFRNGTHRVIDPESTLARVMPLAGSMGITRVAILTGLDRIGIPVAAAVRPNSRSIAQHQGKGMTLAAAKASAVMEAAETYHAESIALPLRLASFDELGAAAAAAPTRLPLAPGGAALGPAVTAERVLWVAAQELMAGTPLCVPFELVSTDFTQPAPPGGAIFQATTNGLAAGNTWLEAVLHAICEVIERDAVAIWRAAPTALQDARAVDLDTVDATSCRRLLALFARAGMQLRVWDASSDIRLPVFVCMVQSGDDTDGVEPQLGSGCHASREIALSRALTEAAQARAAVISGARDDFAPAGYDTASRARQWRIAAHWLRSPSRHNFTAVPDRASTDDLAEDLETALAALEAVGIRQAAWVDLSQPALGIPVVRVIVPGLEGPWTLESGEYVPGARALAARLGAV
jgi:ribosomal protein S12 methylthiotransferase accessory factor